MKIKELEDIEYQILDYLLSQSGWTTREHIERNIMPGRTMNVGDDVYDRLERLSLIKMRERHTDEDDIEEIYTIKSLTKASEYTRQWKLKRSVDDLNSLLEKLINFQTKSTAVETIFTLAILGFTMIQVTSINLSDNAALLIFGIATALSLLIGGGNLVNTLRRQIGPVKNSISHFYRFNKFKIRTKIKALDR